MSSRLPTRWFDYVSRAAPLKRSGTATGGADLSLRSLDVTGKLAGEFKISRSSAEGLSDGIDH
jgi:hypothetical protein